MIEAILAILFIFFLPGFLLVNAVFPRKGELDREYDLLYRITLGIVMSVVVAVAVGFLLNSLTQDFGITQESGKGFFTDENLWAILILLSILLFFLGWFRGAYPFMGKIHPSLLRHPKREPQSVLVDMKEEKEVIEELRNLAKTREELRMRIKDYERRIGQSTGKIRDNYLNKKDRALAELREVDEKLRKIEEQRAKELY
jgi:hypothetical protein